MTSLSHDQDTFKKVADIIRSPDPSRSYSVLKDSLIARCCSPVAIGLEAFFAAVQSPNETISDFMVRLKAFISPTYPAQSVLGEDLVRRRILESLDPRTRLAIYPYEKTSLDELATHADRLLVRVKATLISELSDSSFVSPPQKMINEMFESRLDGIDQVLPQQSTNTPLRPRRTPNPAFSHPSNTPLLSTSTVQHSPSIPRLPAPSQSPPVRPRSLCHYHQRIGPRAHNCRRSYSPMFSPAMHKKRTIKCLP